MSGDNDQPNDDKTYLFSGTNQPSLDDIEREFYLNQRFSPFDPADDLQVDIIPIEFHSDGSMTIGPYFNQQGGITTGHFTPLSFGGSISSIHLTDTNGNTTTQIFLDLGALDTLNRGVDSLPNLDPDMDLGLWFMGGDPDGKPKEPGNDQ